jgi:hypothetical protein
MYATLIGCGVSSAIVLWVRAILDGRLATTALTHPLLRVVVSRGCPQGGVLSPLLWCLVVDDLIARLSMGGVYCQGYADDICLLAVGKFPNMVSRAHTEGSSHCRDMVQQLACQLTLTRQTLSYLQGKGKFLVSLNLFSLEFLCTVPSRSNIWG